MSREIVDCLKTIALAANLLYIEASDGEFGRVQRDRICDALKEIERLLAQEREKVREKCSSVCEDMESWRDWDIVPDLKGSTQAAAAAYYLGNKIRQLDPTKLDEGE